MKDKRLLIIFFTVFIDLVGFGIIIPMNPYLARAFGANPLEVGLLMSVYSLMQFLFSPFWGQFSDRIGRRPVILISLFGGAASHLGFAFATTFSGLMIARALAGLFGGNLSAAMAYIADITPEKDRAKGMGLIGAAFGLGFILGPLIGWAFARVGAHLGQTPPLGESFPAVIAAAICFSNFLFAYFALPESRVGGAVRAKISRFKRIAQAFTTPVLGVAMLLVFCNTFALSNIEPVMFLYVRDQFHWSEAVASAGFAYIGVIMAITQGVLIRRLMPKYGERRVMCMGFLLAAVGFAACSFATHLGLLAFGVTCLGFGNGMTSPSLSSSVSLMSGAEVQGGNLGVSQSLSSLARILGPAVGGFFYQRAGSWAPFAFAAVVASFGFWVVWLNRARLPQGGKVHA